MAKYRAQPTHGGQEHERSADGRRRRVALGGVAAPAAWLVALARSRRAPHGAGSPPQAARGARSACWAPRPPTGATDVASSHRSPSSLSTALAADSPMPTFSPPVAGNWSAISPDELQFVADGPLVPGSSETLTIPGGPPGCSPPTASGWPPAVTVTFTVAPGSTLRLQQLLAQLGYLPVTFTPATQPTSPQQEADAQQGTFSGGGPTSRPRSPRCGRPAHTTSSPRARSWASRPSTA